MTNSLLFNNETNSDCPTKQQFDQWIQAVISFNGGDFQISIQIVDAQTSQTLNKTYRNKDKPTNVLSFPMELPDFIEEKLIGDLAICAEVVKQEAQQQNKAECDHWAHMTIHGTLHLLGYDHIHEKDAIEMESLEVKILESLGVHNPYIID